MGWLLQIQLYIMLFKFTILSISCYFLYVTGPEKTGLIYAKHTYSGNSFSVCAIVLLHSLGRYDKICIKLLC